MLNRGMPGNGRVLPFLPVFMPVRQKCCLSHGFANAAENEIGVIFLLFLRFLYYNSKGETGAALKVEKSAALALI